MAASSHGGRRCALPVKKRQAARKVKMKDNMLRLVSLDSHEAQEIQFACRRTCWDEKNFEYQISDVQLVENDFLQSEFLQKQHELSIEGRSPKELIEEFAFLDVTDKTKRSTVCNSGLTTSLSDTSNSALGEPSQGVTVWRCPDLCIQKETEGGPKNAVVAMFKIMRGRPRTVVPQSNLGLPPKPAQHFDSHVPCVVFSGTDDMTSAMQIYLYELNKVDHRPLSRPRHCCPYAIIHFKNKSCQDVTSAKTAKVAKISKPVASVTKQQPASGRRLIPFGDKMVTYSIAWTGTLTNKDKELGRVDFLAGQGCKVPSLGTKVLRVTTKMGLPSLKDVLPPQCLKNVGSAWDKRLRHESWRYNVLVVRPVQDSRDTMARFCAFLRQSNSATVSTLLVSGAPAPVKLFLMPSCKFTEDLGLGASSDHGKMFAILSYKVLPPSSTHSKQKNKKISKEKTGKPLTEKQPCSPDYMDIDFPHDEYDVGDQVPSLVDSFNTNVFTSVFNLEKPAQKKTDPNIENNQGKGSAITEEPQAGSKVKESSTQQPFRDISSGAIPNTEGRGRRNGVLEQSNFGDDASIGSHRTVDSTSLVLNPVDNAIPVDPRLARRRQPSSESNTSSIENRTPPMETPQSPDSISMMSIPERDFLDRGQSTVSHISSGKDLDLTSGSIQKVEVVDRPENPLVRKSPNAVVTTKDEDSTQKQALDETVQSSNEVMKTSVKPSTLAFLPKKRPVRGIFAHLKNKGPAHVETASLHLDNDLETVDLATTQRPRRSGIPFGSALKITVKNQNVIKEKTTECSTEEKMIKKLKTDNNHSHAVEDTQMFKLSPTKQSLGDNYDDVLMELDSDTNEPEGETQEERDRTDKCKAVHQQNGDIGTTEKVKGKSNTWEQNKEQNEENDTTGKDRSKTDTCKQIKEKNGETDTTKEADAREKKTDTKQAGKLIVPTHHRYNRGDSFYRANLIRNPWLDDNDELMRYRHVVPKGATNISPPRKGAMSMKENGGEKDDSNQQENVQHQGQPQHKEENGSVELETNHSHGHPSLSSNHKAAKGTSEHNSKEACSSSKVLKQEHVKDTQKKVAEDATSGVQENTKPDAQQKDARSREQRPKSSSSSRTFSRSRSKSKSSSVCRTRSRSRSQSRGRNATRSRSGRNRTNKSASRSPRRSPRRRRSRSRSRLRDRSSSKSKDSPQGAMSNAKSIPRARRSGISVPSIGQNVFAGFHMNINSPYRRKRPECRKRSSSSSSSSSSERPRPVYRGRYDQVDRNRRSQVRRNKTKRRCRGSDKRSSRDEDSSGSSLDRRSKRQRRLRSNRSSERNDQQDVNKSDVSRAEQGDEEKHNADSKGKSMKMASPSSPGKKCMEKGGGDSNHCREEKKPMPNERIELVERILFLTTGNVEKFNHSDRVHKHLFHLGIECLKQEAKRLARNKGLGEDWLEEEFLPKHDDGESPDQNFIDKHTSTMTRDDLVREILQLRKELNLTMGNHSNIRKMERKELIASLEELRTSKREILVTSSAAGMTKASGAYMVRREDAKMGCDENPMRSVPQRKGDAFVKAVKDFVTYNKSMWLPSNTDIEEETQKQLVRKTSDDLPAEAALNLPQEFQADSKYHLDVHLVAMQKSNTKSESRNEALKKEMQVDVMMARSFEDRGTIQDRAVKVEAVVAKERGPQTLPVPLSDQPQRNDAENLVDWATAGICGVAMDKEEGETENITPRSEVLKILSSLVEYTTDSSEESVCLDVDRSDEVERKPEVTPESKEIFSLEVEQEEDKAKWKQVTEMKDESDCKRDLEQETKSETVSKREIVLQKEIGVDTKFKSEENLKQEVESESKSEEILRQEIERNLKGKEMLNQADETKSKREKVLEQAVEVEFKGKESFNQVVETESKREEDLIQEVETEAKIEEILKQKIEAEAGYENVLEQGIVPETESKGENISHREIKEETESKNEESLKQKVKEKSSSEKNLKQAVEIESKSEESLKPESQVEVKSKREEVGSNYKATCRSKPVVLNRETKDALVKENKDWVDRVLEQATRPPEKSLGNKEDKDALLKKNKEWVDRVLEKARRPPERHSDCRRKDQNRMLEQSRDWAKRDLDRADKTASVTKRRTSEQSTAKEGGHQSLSQKRRSDGNEKKDAMPVKQAWSAPQPISPTPRNLAMQCSHIPPGGISQAACATGVPEDTLKKAPMMASHREKCLDCSAQPEQTPVKMAEQHQGKPPSENIVATSSGKDCVPMDPRLSSTVQQEFGDVTGSSQGADDEEFSQGCVVGSAPYVRRNLLENELSDAVVGLGKDHGADFSPCDTTSGSSENSPEESQLVPPRGDGGPPDGVVIPTKEQGIGPVSPEGSDRELYQEKDMNPDRAFNSKSQPEKSSVRNDNQIPPAAWRASVVVDYNSNCMQDKVPMFLREKVGLRSHSYPAQQPEWGQRFQEQASGHRYGPPPGQHCDIKASAVFPRPGGHQHGGVGPGQFQKPGPPHAHPPPRMPFCFQQQAPSRHPHPSPPRRLPPPHSPSRPPHPAPPNRLPPPHSLSRPPHPSPPNRLPPPHSPSRPPHPSPPNRLPPPHSPSRPPQPSPPRRPPPSHYPPQQSPPSRHPPSPYRPPPLSPRRACGQTPPRPLMSNIPPRSYHGPPQHSPMSGFASTGQYNKDAEVNSNYRSNFPHSSAGGFTTAGQYNKDTEVNNNNNNYRSDFQQDYSERPLVPPSYPTQGRGIVRGCPRGEGRGQPFPNPGRGRASLGGYANRGGYPQRGRGGFGGRGFMAGTVQGRGRAQSAW
ncbi:titin homolog isoform X2 [Branchiostoma lanceolatum]|uniref:titin homolog isoform X2 n=1 Tax=Branchiostoma lanceolatum TaxID=7740 RepID=UPI0034528B1D